MTVHDRTRLIGPLSNYVDAANPSARQSAFQAFGHDHKVNALGFQGTLLALTGSRFVDGIIGIAFLFIEFIGTGFAVLCRLFVAALCLCLRDFVGQLFYSAIEY